MSYDWILWCCLSCCGHWKVTRSLVSYDFGILLVLVCTNWKVTRSLVSYDATNFLAVASRSIERSPDHWWVTTLWISPRYETSSLKGHQIIGELRLPKRKAIYCCHLLKGHQIIGELRHRALALSYLTSSIERSPDHWWVTTFLPRI